MANEKNRNETVWVFYSLVEFRNSKIKKPDTSFHQYTIFAGLLPLEWARKNDNQPTMKNTNQQRKWALRLSKWLIQQGYNLWQLRNTQAHADTDEPTTTDIILNQKIEKLIFFL